MPPQWLTWLAGAAVAVVISVIATINWLDGKYATKSEPELVSKDLQNITKIEHKVDQALEKLTNLRISLARALGEKME